MAHADAGALSGAVIANPALERAFRESTLSQDARTAVLAALPWVLPVVAFAFTDWQLFAGRPLFAWLIALRAGMLLAFGAASWGILRTRRPAVLDGLTLLVVVVLSSGGLIVNATRPPGQHLFVVEGFIALLGAWAFLPNRWWLQALSAAVVTLNFGLVLALYRDPLAGPSRTALPVFTLLAHTIGALVSRRLHRHRRLAFLAHRSEAAARAAEAEARGALEAGPGRAGHAQGHHPHLLLVQGHPRARRQLAAPRPPGGAEHRRSLQPRPVRTLRRRLRRRDRPRPALSAVATAAPAARFARRIDGPPRGE